MDSRTTASSAVITPSRTEWRRAGLELETVARSGIKPARRTCSLLPVLTLMAAVVLAACSSDSAQGTQNPATEDVVASSDVPSSETTAAERSELDTATTVPPLQTNSTTVPAPSGSVEAVDGTIPFSPIVMSDPVGLDEPSDFGTGVTVRISAAEAAEVVSALPGELGGPSVILTLEFSNSSDSPIDLDQTTVDLSFGDAVPGVPLTTSPSDPVGGVLEAGATTVGTYVFSVPEDELSRIVVTVKYSADAPTAVLIGGVEP